MKYSLYDLCMYVYPAFYFGICVCYAFVSGLWRWFFGLFLFYYFFFLVDGWMAWHSEFFYLTIQLFRSYIGPGKAMIHVLNYIVPFLSSYRPAII